MNVPAGGATQNFTLTKITCIHQLKALWQSDSAGGSVQGVPLFATNSRACVATSTLASGSASTGTVTNGFYLEDEDRSAGIRVRFTGSPLTVNEGDRLTTPTSPILGYLQCDSDVVCLYVQNTPTRTPGAKLGALGMSGKVVSRSASGTGITSGLLASVWGAVTSAAADGSYVYIDDGSGVKDATGNTGIRILTNSSVWSKPWNLAPGEIISVIGPIGQADDSAAGPVPCVRPRYASDITYYLPMLTGTVTD